MRKPYLLLVIAGLCTGICVIAPSQIPMPDQPADTTALPDTHRASAFTTPAFWQSIQLTGGQLTIPFKIRPKQEHGTFHLTTDVTLGAYLGLTRRISKTKEQYLTVPLTAGLTFININDSNTSASLMESREGGADVVPGLSWSTGVVLQLEKFNVGLIFGKDYASEVGDQWIYHRKLWWSFGLGFSFLQ